MIAVTRLWSQTFFKALIRIAPRTIRLMATMVAIAFT